MTTRTFLPLADSPLTNRPTGPDRELAVLLAATATPDPATLDALLAITEPGTASRIIAALEERTDLPPAALARLIVARPDLKAPATRLKQHLFPGSDGCHRFTRAMAALSVKPDTIDHHFLGSEKFATMATMATTVDAAALHDLLTPTLDAPLLPGPADAALAILLGARRTAGSATSPFDLAVAEALHHTRQGRIAAELNALRDKTLTEIAAHTGGLTHAATLWYDALTAAATTPELAGEALALAYLAAPALESGTDPNTPWPAVSARWRQVLAAKHAAATHSPHWADAWEAAATTPEGSAWDPVQRALITGYDLLAGHVRTICPKGAPTPTPDACWALDATGRTLVHTLADHLTGSHGHSPLEHFDDTLLLSFVRELTKSRRDRVPGALHLHGLAAAIKAARSKHHLTAAPTPPRLGLVIPMRGEAQRLTTDPGILEAKTAQLAWLLACHPDARAEVLLVDEDPDGASANAAQRSLVTSHPQIRTTIARRPDAVSGKGGAVLWGLTQLADAGCTQLAYSDCDLTYPLDQLGLLLHHLTQPGTGAAIGSRRQPDSAGYYPASGPPATATFYRQAVCELLALEVSDPQAGFKALDAAAFRTICSRVRDTGLSFDTELLTALQLKGHAIAETGIAALHAYIEGQVGTPRDYDAMLTAVREQAARHGLNPEVRPTPALDRITAAGSLAAAAVTPTVDLPFPRIPAS
ncbi:hypothetical protein AB0N09_05405 [Streptomyces erythrochromogenes]|uniref:hypothetical protein n=1 Tax=Streptomyces erythrochromogenes TaxID=285574 RepID=UPI00344553B4